MQVFSGLTYEQKADGSYRKLSITLDERDLVRLVEDGRVAGAHLEYREEEQEVVVCGEDGKRLTVSECYKVLQKHADALLISQMYKEGVIDVEEAQRQVKAL